MGMGYMLVITRPNRWGQEDWKFKVMSQALLWGTQGFCPMSLSSFGPEHVHRKVARYLAEILIN